MDKMQLLGPCYQVSCLPSKESECMHVHALLFPTLCDPMRFLCEGDYPGKILQQVAISKLNFNW